MKKVHSKGVHAWGYTENELLWMPLSPAKPNYSREIGVGILMVVAIVALGLFISVV